MIVGLAGAFALFAGALGTPTDASAEDGVTVGSTTDTTTDATADAETLAWPSPDWYTPDLHGKIVAAGARGVDVPLKEYATELNCLGYSPPYVGTDGVSLNAVSAGGCMVAPSGCTMNFVFADSSGNKYIGTAGHCAGRGQIVVMQVATRVDPTGTTDPVATLAAVGKVVASWNAGIGKDFAIVKINPGFKVVSGVAGAIGPTGVFCGDPLGQPVMHYGHGYIFFVEQGYAKFGEVVPDLTLVFKFASPNGYNWVGYGLPGDSGSGVMNDAGLAVGNLSHGIGIAGVPVPGLNFGVDMGGIFNLIGSSYKLVTVDGRRASCANPLGL